MHSRWRRRQSVYSSDHLMGGGLGRQIYINLQLSGAGTLVKRSCADVHSKMHTIQFHPVMQQKGGGGLTNYCSPRSEQREWIEGGGWIDEVERGTSQTRHGVV